MVFVPRKGYNIICLNKLLIDYQVDKFLNLFES